MSDLDQRIVELIHGEIDGDNTSAQSEALSRHLAVDPEARAFFERAADVAAKLSRVRALDPPPELHAMLIDAIPARRRERRGAREQSRWWTFPVFARYAFAFGAGLAVASLVLGSRAESPAHMDMSDVTATLMPRPDSAVEREIVMPSVSGRIRLVERDGEAVIGFDVSVQAETRVSTQWGGRADRLHSVVLQRGSHRFAVSGSVPTGDSVAIEIAPKHGPTKAYSLQADAG